MTDLFNTQPAAHSEVWDDDFEFQPTSNASNSAAGPSQPSSSNSTRLPPNNSLDDWDLDQQPAHDRRHPTTSKDTQQQWADSPVRQQKSQHTENWDDDFEDHTGSPAQKTPIRKTHSKKLHVSPSDDPLFQEHENWDADFDAPSTPKRTSPDYGNEAGLDDADDDREFGAFENDDEDRTVTARSRRSVLSQLASSHTPPPPVPPIPFSLLSTASLITAEAPFPRSPAASVFSVPTVHSGRDSYYPNNSTTHLYPTISRSSAGGFSNLPPSPPIHKARERRRLRKKSRPPEAIYEMTAVRSSPHPRESSSEASEGSETYSIQLESPRTPPRSSYHDLPPSDPSTNGASENIGAPSPPNKTPLLSRIGSVKKWGVRKKRASSTPDEVLLQEAERSGESPDLGDPSRDTPSRPSWFFRASSAGTPPSRSGGQEPFPAELVDAPTDTTSKLIKRKSFGFGPIRKNKGPINGGSEPLSNTMSSGNLSGDLQEQLTISSDLSSPSRRSSQRKSVQPRGVSYGGLGLGRVGYGSKAASSTDDVSSVEPDRSRRRSFSRSRTKVNTQAEENGEGNRTFMGNVRRISMVGRHKRTKSVASLANSKESAPSQLGPPFKLEPPSPPRLPTSTSDPLRTIESISPTINGSSKSTLLNKTPGSPQSASLSRATMAPAAINLANSSSSIVPRRNSLGDLKIPARIAQAQSGLTRDLAMVKEFAASVERMKQLQKTYTQVVTEVQSLIDGYTRSLAQQTALRPASPSLLSLATMKNRSRSDTGPPHVSIPPQQSRTQLYTEFYTINSKYRIAWECAELLIDIGTGNSSSSTASAPSTSVSAPAVPNAANGATLDHKRSRERAITLAGDESRPSTPSHPVMPVLPPLASPPNPAWRASTGRHDLNQRQLSLLREMLNNHADTSFLAETLPEAAQSSLSVNREWRWGDAMNSTVTLPSEESSGAIPTALKKRRNSRLTMSGLRDMLRALKRGSTDPPPLPVSTVSLSTESSADSGHRYAHPQVQTHGRRRAKTSSGPESMRDREQEVLNNPYNRPPAVKQSPRRPSLASIFRLGFRSSKDTPSPSSLGSQISVGGNLNLTSTRSSEHESSSNGDDEDWDRLDTLGDLEQVRNDGFATIKGRSPYMQEVSLPSSRPVTPKRAVSGSQTSLWVDTQAPPTRATRLSNVEEHTDDARTPRPSRSRPFKGGSPSQPYAPTLRPMQKSGSVRSMPPQPVADLKLAMTPENIKPLLDNAREVQARLSECIAAIRALLDNRPTI